MKAQGKTRTILQLIFIIYCAVMLVLLFGRPPLDIGKPYWEHVKMNICLVPFRTISGYVYLLIHRTNEHLITHSIINLLGNIVMFIPLGFFLPCLWRKLRGFKRFICCVVVVIIAVEVVQLFSLMGSCDIDDLILNTIGAVIGYLLLHRMTFLDTLLNGTNK